MKTDRKLVLIGLALIAIMVASPLYSAFAPRQQGEVGSKAKASIPALEEALNSGKPAALFFAAIDSPSCESLYLDTWIPIVQRYGNYVYFLILLHSNSTHQAFVDYGVYEVPTLVFISKDGVIVDRVTGYTSVNRVSEILESKLLR